VRDKIRECFGSQAQKGISDKNPVFWISKSKPFSKSFLKRFPMLASEKPKI
jgi:hypothetical protein